MQWAQLVNRKSLTDQINNDVKLTKNVTIIPLETIETTGISKVPNHEKCVNVIIGPSLVDWQGNEICTIPGYNFLKAGSKQVGMALRNLLSRTVTLKRGTVVAHVTAANEIPPKLAPKIIVKASTVNVHPSAGVEIGKKYVNPDMQWVHTLLTPERLDKLFEKLDLSDQERQEIRDLLTEYHDLFALDDLELGKISLVKHYQTDKWYSTQKKGIEEYLCINTKKSGSIWKRWWRLELFWNQLVHGLVLWCW